FFYTRACHRSDLPSFPTRRSSDLPRVGFETVLDVGGDEVPAVERRHVLPPDALAQLERPDAVIGARRPGLRQITLEREVAGAGGLVGERMANETVTGKSGELEEPDRLREARIDHRRIPRRGP